MVRQEGESCLGCRPVSKVSVDPWPSSVTASLLPVVALRAVPTTHTTAGRAPVVRVVVLDAELVADQQAVPAHSCPIGQATLLRGLSRGALSCGGMGCRLVPAR